jgi:DNA-binding transcriptional MerR regulator
MAAAPHSAPAGQASRMHTIGAVRKLLQGEFPDISISKIRYLESQGLLTPSRTRSGYRLFNEADIERLRGVLELQRDEFLPLRVIREELASPTGSERRRRSLTLREPEPVLALSELCRRSQLTPELVDELEEQGLLHPRVEAGERVYTESDAGIAHVCARIAAHGVDARHLRAFRHASDRVSGLVEQITAPALHSRNSERRRAALADTETLLAQAEELVRLLVWRDIHDLVAG